MNRHPIMLLLLAVVATCLSVPLHSFNTLLPHTGDLDSNSLHILGGHGLSQSIAAADSNRLFPPGGEIGHTAASTVRTAPPGPRVNIRYRYYPIVGNTAVALRQQMSRMGPQSQTNGQRYDARTDWHVHWAYNYGRRGGQCAITSMNTRVDVLYILPGWTAPRNTPASLMAEWQRYMGALKTHEIGHKNHGVEAGTAVLRILRNIAPQPTCEALQATINGRLTNAVAPYNQKDLEYDRTTRHGFTQGAVFPSRSFAAAPEDKTASLRNTL